MSDRSYLFLFKLWNILNKCQILKLAMFIQKLIDKKSPVYTGLL